ncbi:transporter substrate-binding domain-containing protein [uncultured Pseudodesulfovibrio sp.]|uniref:substrate-binding periplasmic protein n=1 Tax=uncultured Pseudodesulfovibrio sp. TaxID=2035858 RepID=UPI0029C845A6|nr:transporter substrate-binding domain-containing protein [uncultured Pseudodesulfovibrio sp.]
MKKTIWLFAILFCLAFGNSSARAEDLIFLTEENPPFNHMKAGSVSGVATDVLLRMTEIANIPLNREEVILLPWARGYQRLLNSPNVILYSMAKTSSRKGLFQWIGPIVNVKSVLIARKDSGIRINNLISDSNGRVIGTIRGSASEHVILSKGVSPNAIQRLHNLKLNVQKLKNGRVDMVAMPEAAFLYHVKELGYDPDLFENVHTLLETSLYYGVSRGMDPALVNRLQKALDQLTASGEINRIKLQYR